jgi:hypothetical protein
MTVSEAERRAGAPYCDGCGVSHPDHATCRKLTDPPRYCVRCGRKLAVQVLPTGYTARCVTCG